MKVVAIQLGKVEFGISIDQVLSIEKIQPFTSLPNMPKYVRGVINLRGKVIPIIDLRVFLLGELANDDEEKNRIIVVHVDGTMIGLVADDATDVIDISSEMVQQVAMVGENKDTKVQIAKVEEKLLVLLDVNQLLSQEDLAETLNEINIMM
ncbi:MAG: chemotaxis protein CheW [Tepidibacillus sp.]